jgi:phosphate transport system protein
MGRGAAARAPAPPVAAAHRQSEAHPRMMDATGPGEPAAGRSARNGLAQGRLEQLRTRVAAMGDLVDMAIARAMWGLVIRDRALCSAVIAEDERIDDLRDEVRLASLELLIGGGASADAVRELLGLVEVAEEMERMGDACVEIAEAGRDLTGLPELERPYVALPGLSELCCEQVHDLILAAVVSRDPLRAAAIGRRAERIGAVEARLVSDLVGLMAQDPGSVERASRLILVAVQLARIAERTTRLADTLELRTEPAAAER